MQRSSTRVGFTLLSTLTLTGRKYLIEIFDVDGVRDLSVRLRPQFSLPERVLNVMEDTMLLGVYRHQKCDRRLLKWSFKANVKRSLKRYISELGPLNS